MKDCNLINHALWSAAHWRETSFLLTPDLDQPAGLGLMFENYSAGQQIFTAWREALGETDAKEMLRVSILHGTAPAGKKGYTVHFTTDAMSVITLTERDPQDILIGSRFMFNETLANHNMEWFITSLERHGKYFIFPLPMQPAQDLTVYFSHRLWKTRFYHCEFSSVKPEDADAIALPR
jgi:hypothetical protein